MVTLLGSSPRNILAQEGIRGMGSKLLYTLFVKCLQSNISRVIIEGPEEDAVNFYKKIGFNFKNRSLAPDIDKNGMKKFIESYENKYE